MVTCFWPKHLQMSSNGVKMPNIHQFKKQNNYISGLEAYSDGKSNSKKWIHSVH